MNYIETKSVEVNTNKKISICSKKTFRYLYVGCKIFLDAYQNSSENIFMLNDNSSRERYFLDLKKSVNQNYKKLKKINFGAKWCENHIYKEEDVLPFLDESIPSDLYRIFKQNIENLCQDLLLLFFLVDKQKVWDSKEEVYKDFFSYYDEKLKKENKSNKTKYFEFETELQNCEQKGKDYSSLKKDIVSSIQEAVSSIKNKDESKFIYNINKLLSFTYYVSNIK